MFESLTDRFEDIFSRLRKGGRLSEADIDEVMREIRQALLEADVNFRVARQMVARIKEDLAGAELSKALSPEQQIVKRVNAELVNVLGGPGLKIAYASKPPTVVLLAGLQGAGKTTNAAKLARWFKKEGRNPLLVGADLQRPAAVEQLRVLDGQIGVPVFSQASDPVSVARASLEEARRLGKDVLIVDTAGRLSIDAELMQQVKDISTAVEPHYTFLVIDAMIGQESVSTAEAFNDALALDGVILTKLDGDARGGAALSVKEVVGKPIAFASIGERVEDFDRFDAERMAGRILGMGDILGLIAKAEEHFDQESAEAAAENLLAGRFTFEDFLEQMQAVKKMGPMKGLIAMMPGVPKELRDADIDERELARIEGMIHSMTTRERRDPDLINGSRKLRIANGSGVTTSEINLLLKQFKEVQRQMKSLPMGLGMRKTKKHKKGGRTTPKRTR